jgi:chitodextrinase
MGGTVVDPLSVSITTVSVSPAGASVSIQFAADTQVPSAPGSLSATAPSATSVQLSWGAANDNIGVVGYRVYRGGALVGTTASLSYLDSLLQPQTQYSYEVRAYDAAGNVGAPATASVTTPGADTASPSTPTGLAANVQKGRKVALSWNASNDNVGVVGYDVYRNGSKVAAASGTGYTDRPGRGTFTYQVRARDAAGNLSGLSAAVNTTT